jgi:hypothetical protein
VGEINSLFLNASLSSLSTFIVEAETGLAAAVKDNDYQSLVNVMSYLRQVQKSHFKLLLGHEHGDFLD